MKILNEENFIQHKIKIITIIRYLPNEEEVNEIIKKLKYKFEEKDILLFKYYYLFKISSNITMQ